MMILQDKEELNYAHNEKKEEEEEEHNDVRGSTIYDLHPREGENLFRKLKKISFLLQITLFLFLITFRCLCYLYE